MKTKAREDNSRKRNKIEEKYSWDRMNDAEGERKSHRIRTLIASLIVLSIFFVYVFKLYEVQVSDFEYYATKSESNRIRVRPIQALRGNIFDRNGVIIAKNVSTFDLIIKREKISNHQDFLEDVGNFFSDGRIDSKDIKDQLRNRKLKEITLIAVSYTHLTLPTKA